MRKAAATTVNDATSYQHRMLVPPDKDHALQWLEQAYAAREVVMLTLRVPLWDSLRDEPRFQTIYRRMHFPA